MAVTYYFDRNCGSALPTSLAALKLPVVHHHSTKASLNLSHRNRKETLFVAQTQDDEWLEYIGKQGWIAFSHDGKFHKAGFENELQAIKQFRVGCFYLWGANAVRWQKALCFLRAYEKIEHAVATTPRPFIYRINQKGLLTPVRIP